MSRRHDGAPCTQAAETLRIDRLLWMLRLARSRNAAQAIVGAGHVRRNGQRVTRISQPVCVGDVLTVPVGRSVRVIELAALPTRRGPATEAIGHYREIASNSQQETFATRTLDARDSHP